MVQFEVVNNITKSARQQLNVSNGKQKRTTWLQKYFKSFRMLDNASKLFFARSKDGDKNLEILNGVRFLSMTWVILGHSYFYMMQGALANPLVLLDLFKMFSFNLVSSAPYAVDIFFWLSGFLGVYILLCSMNKRNSKMDNPLMIYLHKYLRIIPIYVLTLLFNCSWWHQSATVRYSLCTKRPKPQLDCRRGGCIFCFSTTSTRFTTKWTAAWAGRGTFRTTCSFSCWYRWLCTCCFTDGRSDLRLYVDIKSYSTVWWYSQRSNTTWVRVTSERTTTITGTFITDHLLASDRLQSASSQLWFFTVSTTMLETAAY